MSHILIALQTLGVKYQVRSVEDDEEAKEFRKTKIGGYDKRKERFTGYVEIEKFSWSGGECHGSFCVMRREKVPNECCRSMKSYSHAEAG